MYIMSCCSLKISIVLQMFDQQSLSFSRETDVALQKRQNQHQPYSHRWIWLDAEFLIDFSCYSVHLLPPCGQCKEWMTKSQRQWIDLPFSDLFQLWWVMHLSNSWLLGTDILLTWPLYNSFITSSLHFLLLGNVLKTHTVEPLCSGREKKAVHHLLAERTGKA